MNRIASLMLGNTVFLSIATFGPASFGVGHASDRTPYDMSAPAGAMFAASLSSDDEPSLVIDIFTQNMAVDAEDGYVARLSILDEGRLRTAKWTESRLCPDLSQAMARLAV